MYTNKYQIRNSTNRQYYWVLKSANNETIITSETYTTKESCKNGIASSKVCIKDENFSRKTSTNGYQYYFDQKANNGQMLGVSEMYNSKQARDHGIEVVKLIAPTAIVEDLT